MILTVSAYVKELWQFPCFNNPFAIKHNTSVSPLAQTIKMFDAAVLRSIWFFNRNRASSCVIVGCI